ncbi:MAG: polymer-forming cytoskeletal protein [Pseudomonadota bacterium]
MFNKSSGSSSGATENTHRKGSSGQLANRGSAVPTLLSQDLVITGDLKTDGEIQVDGRLDGNLTAGKVTIGENGAVNGKIIATTVVIRGKVTGKIDASSIELSETANVQADLIQDNLIVANGAFLDGKCNRKTAAPTPIKAAAKAAE